MRARLASRTGRLRGQRFELAAEATVGRGIDNAIVLDDAQVSTHHARIWFDEERGCYLVEDLDSLNGTEVDGVAVLHPEPLPGLHVITFAGELDFVFQRLADRPAEAAGEEAPPAARAPGPPILAVSIGAGEPQRFPLVDGRHLVGRAVDVDIRLDSEQISRRHARLTVDGGKVRLADLGSRNRTFVDGLPIEREVAVAPGTRIRFGAIEAELVAGE